MAADRVRAWFNMDIKTLHCLIMYIQVRKELIC